MLLAYIYLILTNTHYTCLCLTIIICGWQADTKSAVSVKSFVVKIIDSYYDAVDHEKNIDYKR
jgi:hypothetical protein